MNLPSQRIDELIGRLLESGLGMSQAECCFVERKLGVLLVDAYMHGVLRQSEGVRRLVQRNALNMLDASLARDFYVALEKEAAAIALGKGNGACAGESFSGVARPQGMALADLAAMAGVGDIPTAAGESLPSSASLKTVLADKLSAVYAAETQALEEIGQRGAANAPDAVMQGERTINAQAKSVRTLLAGARSLVLQALNEALFASGLTVVEFQAEHIAALDEKHLVLFADTAAVLLTEHERRGLLERLAGVWAVGGQNDARAVLTDAPSLAALLGSAQSVLSAIESVYGQITEVRRRLVTPYLTELAPPQRSLVSNALKSADAFVPTTAGMCLTALLRQNAHSGRLGLDPHADVLCTRVDAPGTIPDFSMAV